MFNITKLYLDIKDPSDETVLIERKKIIPYFYIFNQTITEVVTYGECKKLKAEIMNDIIKDIKLIDNYHNLIIDTILDKNVKKSCFHYILLNTFNLTVEICSAIIYRDPTYIVHIPNIFYDNEMLEDALCLAPLDQRYLENITISNLFYYYARFYKPNRNKRYLEYILFEKSEKEINDKFIFTDNILSYIKNEERTYKIEKRIVELYPKNIEFANLLSDDDVIEEIKKNKDIIFLINKNILSYNIILETLKLYGNYIFYHKNKNSKINFNFLTIDQFNNLKKELKLFYHNDRFSRKYIKMFNIIDLFKKNMILCEINSITI